MYRAAKSCNVTLLLLTKETANQIFDEDKGLVPIQFDTYRARWIHSKFHFVNAINRTLL